MKSDLILIILTLSAMAIGAAAVLLFQRWFDQRQRERLAQKQQKCLLKVALERDMKEGNAVELLRRCENANVDYLPLLSFSSRSSLQRQLLRGQVDLILLNDCPDRDLDFSYLEISYFGEDFCAVWSRQKNSTQRERLVHSLSLGSFSRSTAYME